MRAAWCPLHSDRGDLGKDAQSHSIGRGKALPCHTCEKLVCAEPVATAGDAVGRGPKWYMAGAGNTFLGHLFPSGSL